MVKRGVRRLLARNFVDIRQLAVTETVLCPDETAQIPPAVFLPGALERIKTLSPWRNWDVENLEIHGGEVKHAATVAYTVKDVDVSGAFLYAGAAKIQPGYGRPSLFLRDVGKRRFLEQGNLVTSNSGSYFFGTLLLDDFPLSMIAADNPDNFAMVTRPYEHEAGYRKLLGLPQSPILGNARVRNLTMYIDYAQNSYKAARYRELRARLRGALSGRTRPCPGVYIKRGATGEPRVLENEPAVTQFLADQGFEVIDPATSSAEEIAARSLDARIVVAIEGSHLSHAIYSAADDCAFLVLQPPDRFAMAYKELTDRLDMTFAFLVGDRSQQGFTIPLDDLKRMLELLDSKAHRAPP
jgi:hypothetical protein